ncbi:MAG: hypothetical protein GXP40_03850 [Chloroflexi bacterium]|nr:hypothetical protein [Chloroflexota bacterium]
MDELTPAQTDVVAAPLEAKIFLSGPAGCGKTTVGVARMLGLLEAGVPGASLLVLTPQRTLQEPYQNALRSPEVGAGGQVTLATVGGLARRTVDLFWPLAAEAAGFANPDQPPVFLTLETAQYYMAHIVRPLLEEGYFESLTINRNRLYAQIIDNLNKAAAVGFPHTEIGARLDAAWLGDPSQRRVYADAQDCANRFRDYCLEHNLLDFSLQLEIFRDHLWPDPLVRGHLTQRYRHLIYDNLEEDIPLAHDLIADWLPDFDSALLIFDEGGGYRRFLGADPETGRRLSDLCPSRAVLAESFVVSEEVERLARSLENVIIPAASPSPLKGEGTGASVLKFSNARFYPEVLDWVTDEIAALMDGGLPASEIVVLAPYLSDALRFSLMNRLEARRIPARSHRPSRSLRDEPAAQALLTLAEIAHPDWGLRPTSFDAAYAFMLALESDLVRAQLLAEIVYRQRDLNLSSFERIKPDVQERITFVLGSRYTQLRDWLLACREREPMPLDHFLRRLFGEVLSQPGFGFHRNFDAARVAASLIESAQKFRRVMEPANFASQEGEPLASLGREYIAMLQEGVIAAQYLESWRDQPEEAVLIAPAYTFLMQNRPVTAQFWLNPGSEGWTERLFQPLTQPYVLSRHWPKDGLWTDADEVAAARGTLARLLTGLLRRCRERLYLGISDLGESGFEQRGVLLKAFQRVLQEANRQG